ncbi:MAG: GntR family transcriptional regulator [Bacteroidota bacterium]
MEAPRYKAVYQYLKKIILSGDYPEGSLLPSENELSRRFNVTRPTVRQALNTLVQERYIYKHHGKGSIVSIQRKTLGLLSFRGFTESLQDDQLEVATKLLEGPVLQDWPEDFFYPIPENLLADSCFFLKRLRSVNKAPIMLEYTWLPSSDLKGFTKVSYQEHSLFGTLRQKYHIEVTSVDQQVKAICANKQQAHILGMKEDDALLHIYRKYSTNRSAFFLYSALFCNTNTYSISSVFT